MKLNSGEFQNHLNMTINRTVIQLSKKVAFYKFASNDYKCKYVGSRISSGRFSEDWMFTNTLGDGYSIVYRDSTTGTVIQDLVNCSYKYHVSQVTSEWNILCLQIAEIQKVTANTKISRNQEFCFLLFVAMSVYAGSLKQQ